MRRTGVVVRRMGTVPEYASRRFTKVVGLERGGLDGAIAHLDHCSAKRAAQPE